MAAKIAIGLKLLIQYRDYLRRKRLREGHIARHTRIIFDFLLPLENKSLSEINQQDVLNYCRRLKRRRAGLKTINRRLRVIKIFFDWFKHNNYI